MKNLKEYTGTILEFKANRGNSNGKIPDWVYGIPSKYSIISKLELNGFHLFNKDDNREMIRLANETNTKLYCVGEYIEGYPATHYIKFCIPGEQFVYFMRDLDAYIELNYSKKIPSGLDLLSFGTIDTKPNWTHTFEEFDDFNNFVNKRTKMKF